MKVVPSIYPQCVKFISLTIKKTICRSQKQSRTCYMSGFQKTRRSESKQQQIRDFFIRDPGKYLPSTIALGERFPEKYVSIGNNISPYVKKCPVSISKTEYPNVRLVSRRYARDWHQYYLSWSERWSNVQTGEEKTKKLGSEQVKLQYPNWLANPVVVKKWEVKSVHRFHRPQ